MKSEHCAVHLRAGPTNLLQQHSQRATACNSPYASLPLDERVSRSNVSRALRNVLSFDLGSSLLEKNPAKPKQNSGSSFPASRRASTDVSVLLLLRCYVYDE